MTGGEYNKAKEAINSGQPISKKTFNDLVALKEQHRKHIDKLTVMGDIKQALYFRDKALEMVDLIERAEVYDEAS